MNKYRKLRRLAEIEAKGATLIFWQDGDGSINVGPSHARRKLTKEQFDEYVERELPANAEVIVLHFAVTEELLSNGSGLINVKQETRKFERRHS